MSEAKLRLPEFKTEAEEAQWWASNQDLIAEKFESAAAEGRLTRGSVARRAQEQGAISLDA